MEYRDALTLCRVFENLEDTSVQTMCALEEMLNETFDEFIWQFEPVNGDWEVWENF